MGKKKHKHEEHENLERWLVSYADFITLLFAFFTVLYATSQADKQKYKQTAESIQRAFLSGSGIFPLKGTPFNFFQKTPDKGAEVPPSPKDQGKLEKSADQKMEQQMEKIRDNIQGLFQSSTGLAMNKGDVEVFRTEQGFKIRLTEEILFNSGSEKLKRNNIPFIYEMGKRLARTGLTVQVEGHTDNREVASHDNTPANNWTLSLNRSYNLVRFLVEGSGFPKNKISVSGYGDTQPIADNNTPEGRKRNRRVEISVITQEQNLADLPW